MGWTYAFHNMCELESFHESYSYGILPDKNFQHCNFIKREKWMKGYALNKWESTLNPVFMPMGPMYTFIMEASHKVIIPLL